MASDIIDVSDLVGVPFVPFGRDAKKGLDCYGLVLEVARRYGRPLRDIVKRHYTVAQAEQEVDEFLNVVKTNDYYKPCVVLEFRFKPRGELHCGITIDYDGTFLQATKNQGVRVSSLASCKGYLKLEQAYEIIGRERDFKKYHGYAF